MYKGVEEAKGVQRPKERPKKENGIQRPQKGKQRPKKVKTVKIITEQ